MFFAHWSSLHTKHSVQWKKRLHTGEFVSFSPTDATDPNGSRQAVDIQGVNNEPLLVEHGDLKYMRYSRIGLPPQATVTMEVVAAGGGNEQNSADALQIPEA